jgi:anti-anti-sigma regulatory factor
MHEPAPAAVGSAAGPVHACRIDLLAAPRYNVLTISGVVDRATWQRIQPALRRLGSLMRPTVLRLDAVSEIDPVTLRGLVETAAERRPAQQPPILVRSVSPPVAAALAALGMPFVPDLDLTGQPPELLAG